jgi:formylglycine-generating enzyme required for sulfatase activity
VHTVSVSAFYMDRNLVTKAQWDEVFSWAASQQPWYNFDAVGIGKGSNYPAQPATWYDCVKWCNARSEKEGLTPCYYVDARHTPANVYRGGQVDIQDDWVAWNSGGYRLPTEAEWEKAARGGVSGGRFPWGDTIDHDRANYISFWQGIHPFYPYDAGYEGHDTRYEVGAYPFTSPVGSFAPNGYGLYDVAGNLRQWCWDWYDAGWYANGTATQSDTHGPATGNSRLLRNGAWYDSANYSRCSSRVGFSPQWTYYFGFRCVR